VHRSESYRYGGFPPRRNRASGPEPERGRASQRSHREPRNRLPIGANGEPCVSAMLRGKEPQIYWVLLAHATAHPWRPVRGELPAESASRCPDKKGSSRQTMPPASARGGAPFLPDGGRARLRSQPIL